MSLQARKAIKAGRKKGSSRYQLKGGNKGKAASLTTRNKPKGPLG